MASWYINRTFFFDVHPPLGKMMIAAMGYSSGYNGTHPFEKPGDLYNDHPFLGMRGGCTLLAEPWSPSASSPFGTSSTPSPPPAWPSACFLIFDIGILVLNRCILLDLILLFFIPGPFSMSQFRTIQEPFMTPWWTWPSSSK